MFRARSAITTSKKKKKCTAKGGPNDVVAHVPDAALSRLSSKLSRSRIVYNMDCFYFDETVRDCRSAGKKFYDSDGIVLTELFTRTENKDRNALLG